MKLEQGMAAVVTGGASGLGRASAAALAQAGLKVAIFDINDAAGEEHAAAIGGTFHHVDIMDEDSVEQGFASARAANGQERVTVHCAMASKRGKTLGWDKQAGGYRRLPTEDYAFGAEGILVASYRVASISALGMANADPLNEDGERGAIVLTASVAAQDGQIGQVIYGSCKAGVNGLVLPMARDLMDVGIRVNSVMPGIFATPLMLGMKDRNPAMWEQLNASVPFPKRLGEPEEFASLILEIARNSYINGHQFRLDGAIRMPPR
ncbi:SDR family oxidoreductase [Erythrobacter sp. HL-111]|uniref:SDR family oxidoreductase n=1 Tax=Erythrobacter sp. HL-111 TaxID=1798193 RepID=UPI0006D9E59D|nr:SDR family oxidoreductase [Erythrobacter sp. HL-111]KPP91172.1 MAG: Dehydrogenase [Erythrobacteraceae bacterium HL-111]SDS44425.1 NAD(P)-dependent dehydrogenase, short-chain alcohol dehydrogenase family [Erythrobacter sp. HL-111]